MTERELIENQFIYGRPAMRPTLRTWIKHILLLAVTFCTATVAGTLFPFGRLPIFPESDPQTAAELIRFLVMLPVAYAGLVVSAVENIINNPAELAYGLSFSISLLFILLCHEMGHYIACRIYRVDATLPFFLPTPPMIGPAGTFGAFIKILSPLPSRKAVFDIGVAGPIAGFIALMPVALIGYMTMTFGTMEDVRSGNVDPISFSNPLFFELLEWFVVADPSLPRDPNAFYFAAWVGLLITALNLIPSGQLDGGHAVYAVLGEKVHYWCGRIAFIIMAVLSVAGMYFYNSPSGFLIAILLGVMMRVRHPNPMDQSPLGTKRIVIALLTLLIFVSCFVPFPIQIN